MAKKSIYTITSITPQKKSRKRFSIFLDEEYWKSLDKELVFLLNLREGKKVTPKDLEGIIFAEERKKALDKALRLLGYRPRSVSEVERRLKEENYDEKVIDEVIKYLTKIEYLNDEEFTRIWIKDRVAKLYGPFWIKSELYKKGVKGRIIDDLMKDLYPEELECKKAYEAAKKKLKVLKSDKNSYGRLLKYVLGRGFQPSVAYEVCQKTFNKYNFSE